jgi:hypothetical protein
MFRPALARVRQITPIISSFAAAIIFTCCLAGFWVARLHAQPNNAQRTVQGKVIDKGSAPIQGAVVYLKDDHSLAIKSFISMQDGSFRFGQLAQNTDYELWAESGGKKSPTKSISSFDNKKEFDFRLTVDTSK